MASGRTALIAWLLTALLASPAAANLISGFETVDDNGTAANRDPVQDEFDCDTNTNVEGDARLVQQGASTGHVRNANNGGAVTSSWALRVSTTGTNRAVCRRTGLNTPTLTFTIAIHADADADLGVARTVAAVRQGSAFGVGVRLKTDRTFEVWYGTESNVRFSFIGTATERACWASGNTDSRLGCTGTCPAGFTCGNGSSVCADSDGAGCFWAPPKITEEHIGTVVRLTAYFDGRKVGTSVFTPTTPAANITEVWVGGFCDGASGACSSSGTFIVGLDDYADSTTTQLPEGYVEVVVPSADGSSGENSFNTNCTGGSSGQYICVDDWGSGGQLDGGSHVNASTANKSTAFNNFTPVLTQPAYSSGVHAVQWMLAGRSTSTDAGTREMRHYGRLCESSTTCAAPDATTAETFTIVNTTAQKLLHRRYHALDPLNTAWTLATANRLSVRYLSGPILSQGVRFSAVAAYVRMMKPNAPRRSHLRTHAIGPDPSASTICAAGHSNVGGTQGGQCVGGSESGVTCTPTVAKYCSYDATERDNECAVATDCNRCTGRTADNGGAGWPCTSAAHCPIAGTCSGGSGTCTDAQEGTCSGGGSVPCACDAHCALGGACDSSFTCEPQCADGGVCQGAGGWVFALSESVAADRVISYGAGGYSSKQWETEFPLMAVGRHPIGVFVVGTGQCLCRTGGDCPGGGSCLDLSGGACDGGDVCQCVGGSPCIDNTTCRSCTGNDDCGPGQQCLTKTQRCACASPTACTQILMNVGGNDGLMTQTPHGGHPDQNMWLAVQAGMFGDPFTAPACESDGGCASGLCLGTLKNNYDSWCQGGNTCAVWRVPCNDDPDCQDYGQGGGAQVCSDPYGCVGEGTPSDCTDADDGTCVGNPALGCSCDADCQIVGWRTGWCEADDQDRCPANYAPDAEGICRRECSGNGDCRDGANGQTVCTNGLCEGRCVPSCGQSCSVMNPCPIRTWVSNEITRTAQGECVGGVCQDCGHISSLDAGFRRAYLNFLGSLDGFALGYESMVAMQNYLDGLSESDGRPLFVPMTEAIFRQPLRGFAHWMPPAYVAKMSALIMRDAARLPVALDLRAAGARHSAWDMHLRQDFGAPVDGISPGIHWTGPDDSNLADRLSGMEVAAGANADLLNAANHCAVGACIKPGETWTGRPCGDTGDCPAEHECSFRGLPRPVTYCQTQATGAWTSTTCSAVAPCPTGQSCELRPCACVCTTTKDCENLFGPGTECGGSPLRCRRVSDGVDACEVAYGSGFSCDVSGDQRCEHASSAVCPATLDGCWVANP